MPPRRVFILLLASSLLALVILSTQKPGLRILTSPKMKMADAYARITNNDSGFGEEEEEKKEWKKNAVNNYEKKKRFEGIQSSSLDIEEADDDIETFMKNREKEYERRRLHLKRVCKEYGKPLRFSGYQNLPFDRFRWLNSKKLMTCYNAKVGTTTWSNLLVKLEDPNFDTERSIHSLARTMLTPPYPPKSEETRKLMDSYTKVISVREPFVRLVSAYKNKIRHRLKHRYVLEIERFLGLEDNFFKRNVPFEAFAKHVVHATSAEDDVREKWRHFTDIHWFPYYANCAPCDVDYAIITKAESFSEDLKYIAHRFKLNLTDTAPSHSSKTSSEEEALTIFRAFPRNLTLALYERFRPDFDLFDYSVDKYLAEEEGMETGGIMGKHGKQ